MTTLESAAASGLAVPPAGLAVHLLTTLQMTVGIARPDGDVHPRQQFTLETVALTEAAFLEALRQFRGHLAEYARENAALAAPTA